MSEAEEFIAPYLLPHEVEDLIISYTQRNNEQVGYWEPKAHMPKTVDLFIPDQKDTKPPVGSVCLVKSGVLSCAVIPEALFVVVRNEEWPHSLQVICSRTKLIDKRLDFLSHDLVNNNDPLPDAPGGIASNLDDYLFTVVEIDSYTVRAIQWVWRLGWIEKPFTYNRYLHRVKQTQRRESEFLGTAINRAGPGEYFDVIVKG